MNIAAHSAGGGSAGAKAGGALRARSNGHDAASAAVQDLTEQVCARMQPLRIACLALHSVLPHLLQPRQDMCQEASWLTFGEAGV